MAASLPAARQVDRVMSPVIIMSVELSFEGAECLVLDLHNRDDVPYLTQSVEQMES